jgi:hypothetical protein
MKRPILVIVLALGTVAGFGTGITSAIRHHRAHRAELVQHIADVCVQAAKRANVAPEEQ